MSAMIKFSKSGLQEVLRDYGEDELANLVPSIGPTAVDRIGETAMELSIDGMTIEKALLHAATSVLASREPRRRRRLRGRRRRAPARGTNVVGTMPKTRCAQLPTTFDGQSVADIEALRDVVEQVAVDPMTWTTTYRCRVCGTRWIEKYEERGHGEVPSVRREGAARS